MNLGAFPNSCFNTGLFDAIINATPEKNYCIPKKMKGVFAITCNFNGLAKFQPTV